VIAAELVEDLVVAELKRLMEDIRGTATGEDSVAEAASSLERAQAAYDAGMAVLDPLEPAAVTRLGELRAARDEARERHEARGREQRGDLRRGHGRRLGPADLGGAARVDPRGHRERRRGAGRPWRRARHDHAGLDPGGLQGAPARLTFVAPIRGCPRWARRLKDLDPAAARLAGARGRGLDGGVPDRLEAQARVPRVDEFQAEEDGGGGVLEPVASGVAAQCRTAAARSLALCSSLSGRPRFARGFSAAVITGGRYSGPVGGGTTGDLLGQLPGCFRVGPSGAAAGSGN
jgi:hypothetical protein